MTKNFCIFILLLDPCTTVKTAQGVLLEGSERKEKSQVILTQVILDSLPPFNFGAEHSRTREFNLHEQQSHPAVSHTWSHKKCVMF
jgi:hypothetical protein